MTVASARAPFLDLQSFTTGELAPSPPPMPAVVPSRRSPFLSVYELDGRPDGESTPDSPLREAYAAFVDHLHDEEFDEALYELQSHARALHDEHMALGSSRAEADRLVGQRFSQLTREAEAAVDALAHRFAPREEAGLEDREFDTFLDEYAPSGSMDPEFENFFGKLIKKVVKGAKAVAGKALKGVKALALGPILNAIKGLLNPLLKRVMQKAIGLLPPMVRPAAQMLAAKLGFAAPAPAPAPAPAAPMVGADATALDDAAAAPADADADPTLADPAAAGVQDAAGSDAVPLQQEFDEQLASAFLAQDEAGLQMEVAELRTGAALSAVPVFAQLDDARERFIRELEGLKEGESAEPHIQNFLPAVLPALRLGLRVAGRERVVNFLAGLLAKLIGKLIGPAQAPALSKAIVNAGLKLLSLEMNEEDEARLGASAVAATVEETVSRVAALPDFVLDHPQLLEGFALEAFEQAAAANLPAVFSEETYRRRPGLLEGGLNAGWVLMPLRGPKRYKRCTRTFNVRISPHLAEEIESFDGAPIADQLQDLLGLPEGTEVEAEVHLYEALPGTSLADIARGEKEVMGSAHSDEVRGMQLHPLTPQAAGMLLGRPGLGRPLPHGMQGTHGHRFHRHGHRHHGGRHHRQGRHHRHHRHHLGAGQRFYHLRVPGRPLLSVPGPADQAQARRQMHLRATLDSTQDQVRVCLFLSEVKAQKLAVRVRQQSNVGTVAVAFRRWVAQRLMRVFQGQAPQALRVVHAGMPPGQSPAAALAALPRGMGAAFAGRMQEWLVRGLGDFLTQQAAQLLAAAQDPAEGVTLRFTIERPPGLKEFCQALVEPGAAAGSVAGALASGTAPQVRVEAVGGHRCA
jgi:hypothetical protein